MKLQFLLTAPHTESEVTIPVTLPKTAADCYLKLTYFTKTAHELVPVGHEVGFDQFLLSGSAVRRLNTVTDEAAAPTVIEGDRFLTVSGEGFTYQYDTFTGIFSSLERGSETISMVTAFSVHQLIMTATSVKSGSVQIIITARHAPTQQSMQLTVRQYRLQAPLICVQLLFSLS